MTEEIKIQRATINDLNTIQQLGAELAEFEHKNWDSSLDPKWPLSAAGEQAYRKAIENRYTLIALRGEEAIGFLIGDIQRPAAGAARQITSAHLGNIYVREKFRESSIGSKLLANFKNYCKANNASKLTTTVIAQNTNAIEFYQQQGFEPSRMILAQDL